MSLSASFALDGGDGSTMTLTLEPYALADRVDVRGTRSDWTAEKRNALLLEFWNALMDAYGQRPVPDLESFERTAGVVLERNDAED